MGLRGVKPKPRQVLFWPKVDMGINPGDCWLWTAGISPGGYGRFARHDYAHRLSYQWIIGPIPRNLVIDHLCRVRHCVNPSHMELVSNKENILRGVAPSAHHAQKTHCVNGHAFAPQNILRTKGRHTRICRECKHIRDARVRAKRRELAN